MKKKHRRAVYYAIVTLITPFVSPFILFEYLGACADWINSKALVPMCEWLATKLRVYDYDPD